MYRSVGFTMCSVPAVQIHSGEAFTGRGVMRCRVFYRYRGCNVGVMCVRVYVRYSRV